MNKLPGQTKKEVGSVADGGSCVSKVERPRIACQFHHRAGWGQWEGRSTWRSLTTGRQTHLDFMLGPTDTKEQLGGKQPYKVNVLSTCMLGRESRGSPKMPTSSAPEPMNVSHHMLEGTLQIWLN